MAQRLLLPFLLLLLPAIVSAQGRRWTVTLEEPTGIERRDNEVVRFEASFGPKEAYHNQLRILDSNGRELPIQVATAENHPDGSIKAAEILFPATMIPGQRPRFTLMASPAFAPPPRPNIRGGDYQTDILIRRLGVSRLELGNSRFAVIINLGKDETTPAIVEAYNRTAGDQRMLNLVETTPDIESPLAFGVRSSGWGTFLGKSERTSGFEAVEIVEQGPLRARVRLNRARVGGTTEDWEFEWHSQSPVLIWRTRIAAASGKCGFFFSAVSASPYEPFTHWAAGRETGWPDGWETDNPPHITISPRDMDDLPGSQILYYNPLQNYGAVAVIELDTTLKWVGIGGRQFYAAKEISEVSRVPGKGISAVKRPEMLRSSAHWSSQIAISFPQWRGTETLLEARASYRRFAQPILANLSGVQRVLRAPNVRPANRTPVYTISSERLDRGIRETRTTQVAELSLNGIWRLQHAEKGDGERQSFFDTTFNDSDWQSVQVPGSVHTQILKYPAYYTRDAEWISFKEWWYRRSFRVPAAMKGKRLRLSFEATDYYADIWLNGRLLGRHEGYIDPFEFEVGDRLLLDEDNTIAVRVWTPVDYYWRHRPYTVKGSYGAVDQKPDDITALGITRSVRLIANGPVVLEDIAVRPSINSDGSADLEVQVTLDYDVAKRTTGRLELNLAPRNFAGRERIKALADLEFSGRGSREILVRFNLQKPELWWTWDHGRPNLYTLSTQIALEGKISDSQSQAVGIREIEKVGWIFYLNGRRIYIRGTNSYYLELFMSEMNRQKYERDVNLMKDMHVNMIRLHCHFQNSEFYDLCDELGILVWQDYLEAWYPRDIEFSLKAARLYDPHIRMVRNHPCIAIWATSDEEDLENYRVLTKHLAPRLYANDPQRRAVVRSTGRYGDGHIYYGWYGGSIWEYTETEERFISELGATALPDYETLIQFLPDHWPIEDHQEEWIFRKLQITEAMRAWGRPKGKSLREYIPQTQAYVARLHQLAIERMRRRKYEAGGILHFHAIDFWPSVTMAALDYFRRPTKSYLTVQRSFQMVLASLEYDRDIWKVGEDFHCGLWVVNDHWFAIPGASVRWQIIDEADRVVFEGRKPVDIAEDSSVKLEDLKWNVTTPGKFELRASVFDGRGTELSKNIYEFEVK